MNKLIIFLTIVWLFVPFVLAEEKYVETNINITYDGKDLLIDTDSVLDESQHFKFVNITNSSWNQEITYIIKKDLECTAEEVTNLTKKIMKTCEEIDYSIVNKNLNLTKELAKCKTNNDTFEVVYNRLDSCNSQKASLQATIDNKQEDDWQKFIPGAIGGAVFVFVVGAFSGRKWVKEVRTNESKQFGR